MNDALFWTDPDGTRHERCKLAWHHSGEWLCETPFDPGEQPGLGWPRGGWAFYCHWCVDIWARVVLFNSDGRQMPCEVVSVACLRHPDSWNVPGSILANRQSALLPLLPVEVLRREFAAHMQYYNNLQGEEIGSTYSAKRAHGS